MSRIRSVKPAFFRHEKLQEMGPLSMLIFQGLWTQCDKAGRFAWRPRTLKLDILPFIDFNMEVELDKLAQAGFITKYEAETEFFGLISSFGEHQRISGKEAQEPVRYPDPPAPKSRKKRLLQEFSLIDYGEAIEKQSGSNREASENGEGSNGEATPRAGMELRNGVQERNGSSPLDLPPDRGEGAEGRKREKKEFPLNSAEYEAAEFFAGYLVEWAPTAKPPDKARLQAWARIFDLVFRVDGRTHSDLNDLLDWMSAQKPGRDGFLWRNVVLSPDTLRQRWNEGKFTGFLPSRLLQENLR